MRCHSQKAPENGQLYVVWPCDVLSPPTLEDVVTFNCHLSINHLSTSYLPTYPPFKLAPNDPISVKNQVLPPKAIGMQWTYALDLDQPLAE